LQDIEHEYFDIKWMFQGGTKTVDLFLFIFVFFSTPEPHPPSSYYHANAEGYSAELTTTLLIELSRKFLKTPSNVIV